MSERELQQIQVLFDKEKDFLWAQAMGLTRKSEDAEDLYQETMLKAFKGFGGFQPNTNFRAWVGKIMLNTHINNYNRKRNNQAVICDFSSGDCDHTVYHSPDGGNVSESDSPEKVFFSQHIDGELMQTLYSLPDTYKTPFALYHVEGYSYEEISQALDVPLGTVKSRIFRARRMMQEAIENLWASRRKH